MGNPDRVWTETEDDIIRAHYERGRVDVNVLGYLLSRPRRAVQDRAFELGLARPRPTPAMYEKAALMIQAGVSLKLTAQELDMNICSVQRACRLRGIRPCERKVTRSIPRESHKHPPKPKYVAALDFVRGGMSYAEAARKTGFTWQELAAEGKRLGLVSRFGRAVAKRRYAS